MCLLIANPDNQPIDLNVIETATESNPDGFGFAFVKDGEVKIHKPASCDPYKQLSLLKKYGWPQLIHWRYTTSGETCDKFAHPFRLNKTSALAHNGVLPIKIQKGLSDTATLVKSLRKKPHKAVNRLKKLDYKGNKFAVLNTRNLHIVNEEAGEWRDGIWYSNKTGFESRWGSYKTCKTDDYSTIDNVESSATQLIRDAEWELADDYLEESSRRRLEDLVAMLEWWKEGNQQWTN